MEIFISTSLTDTVNYASSLHYNGHMHYKGYISIWWTCTCSGLLTLILVEFWLNQNTYYTTPKH